MQKSVFALSTTASKGTVPSGSGANMSASSTVPSTRSCQHAAGSVSYLVSQLVSKRAGAQASEWTATTRPLGQRDDAALPAAPVREQAEGPRVSGLVEPGVRL